MILLTLICCITGLFSPSFHDFHVSHCSILYTSESGTLEVTQQVFTDDFEDALRARFDQITHLNSDRELANTGDMISQYLDEHFAVYADDHVLPFQYLGKEEAEDPMATRLYVEVSNVPKSAILTVKYDVLCELFGDQRNIISFSIDKGKKQMLLVDKSNPSVQVSLP